MKKITPFFLLTINLFFTVTTIAQAPVLESNTTIDYYENSGPVSIHPTIILTDANSTTMSEAHVDSDPFESYEGTTLVSNPATMGDIYGEPYIDEGWFDVFSASNTATLAEWQEALRSVTYTNTSEDPVATTRLYTFSIIDDEGQYSNTVVVGVNIIPINDAPIRIAGTIEPLTVNEDDPSTDLGLSGLDYDPIEASQTMSIVVTAIPSSSLGAITLANGTPVILGGSYTLSQLHGMRFLPALNGFGSGTFAFAATDDGGTLHGGVDSVSESIFIIVNSLSDIPAISGSYCQGSTSVSGTSVDADDTVIKLYSGSTPIATALVSSGSWTAAVSPLAPNVILTATGTVSGGIESAPSLAVTVVEQIEWYLDADGDRYYTGSPVLACDSPGSGYVNSNIDGGGDCIDSNAAVNPGRTEICYNNIDDDCDTVKSEACPPVVVNMTASYHNSTLPSFSTSIPAVGYTYAGATNLKYRFSITNLTTGATSSDIIQTSRYVTIPAALHLYGARYTIKVSAVINEELVDYSGNIITVNAPTIQMVTLSSVSCGATLASLTSTLSSNSALNATGYMFRIRLNDNNPSPSYAYSQSATRFVNANSFTGFPLQYASSYKIAVQYTYNDPVTNQVVISGYGAECTVNTPSIPVIRLAAPVCDSRALAMNSAVTATSASYATGYQFRIRLFSENPSTATYYTTPVTVSRFSSLAAFQGIALTHNTDYSVSVRYSVWNGSTTVWSDYGSECKISTPLFPKTQVVPSQCGQHNVALDYQFNIVTHPGFPQYVVKLEELSTEDESIVDDEEITTSYSHFRLNQFSIAQVGKRYNISIALRINGVLGDFHTVCDIDTIWENGDGTQDLKLDQFVATAYPNPFANNFMLDVKTSSTTAINVKVYDMLGRMLEQKDIRVSDIEATAIGNQYPSGVYNVVVSQGDSVQTVRVVKR